MRDVRRAVLRIQRQWRAFLARQAFIAGRWAAQKVQAIWRGSLGRRAVVRMVRGGSTTAWLFVVGCILSQAHELMMACIALPFVQHVAAILIQAAWHGSVRFPVLGSPWPCLMGAERVTPAPDKHGSVSHYSLFSFSITFLRRLGVLCPPCDAWPSSCRPCTGGGQSGSTWRFVHV